MGQLHDVREPPPRLFVHPNQPVALFRSRSHATEINRIGKSPSLSSSLTSEIHVPRRHIESDLQVRHHTLREAEVPVSRPRKKGSNADEISVGLDGHLPGDVGAIDRRADGFETS